MVNGGDLFICLVAGLAVPLAIVDGLRAAAGAAMSHRPEGLHVEHRLLAWLFVLLAGPGLFVERMIAVAREGQLSFQDAINAVVITLGWAALYGFVVLSLAGFIPTAM